ncbi:hypothetical protein BT69DRAFT_472002 [Atractiella rhizophila]|nr:hypothetical protein BT69DRAFT_472002 [Atractiella rhizophila]
MLDSKEKQKRNGETPSTLEEDYDHLMVHKKALLQRVLQSLILESGIDWVGDDDLIRYLGLPTSEVAE